MQVKRYEAASIREAMVKIKKDLGSDAILLSTKRLRGAPSPLLEVIAAREIDDNWPSALDIGQRGGDTPFQCPTPQQATDVILHLRDQIEGLKALILEMKRQSSFSREFTEMKESMNTFFDIIGLRKEPGRKEAFSRIYYNLIGLGLSRQKVSRLMEKMKRYPSYSDKNSYEEGIGTIRGMIEKSFVPAGASEKNGRVKVLVGPTGVGKTTTLAKLAARYTLENKWKVGLITTDTFRIAATDQLKVYAGIIGIPMEIVSEREGFSRSLRNFEDRDVILVDTPGNNGHDDQYLRKLKDMMAIEVPVQTDLLLSLASNPDSLLDAAERFGTFDYDHIILTKLDECVRFGTAYEVIDRIGKPVSYVTTGQNVPQDIEEATPEKLTKLVMENDLH
jgi:flagellar biosynthesis protein FlhF